MIAIRKSATTPQILQTQGVTKRNEHCANFDIGNREFAFDRAIYAHLDVKNALIQAQHGKCCFCETFVADDGQVEHFRPKAAASQGKGKTMHRPGYYWLAYDWDNLLLCCASCNQRHKGNLFPLADDAKRARSHHDDLGRESAVFIHPAKEDPELFFGFDEYTIKGGDSVGRGKKTVTALALNSPRLTGLRRERYEILTALVVAIRRGEDAPKCPADIVQGLRNSLRNYITEDAQFLAMTRATLQSMNFSLQ